MNDLIRDNFLQHHGILGQKWGIRRFQPYGEGGYDPKRNGKFIGKVKDRISKHIEKRRKKKEARIDKFESFSKFRKDLNGYAYSKASADLIKKDIVELKKRKSSPKIDKKIEENELMVKCFEKYVKDNEDKVRKQAAEQLIKSPYWTKGHYFASTPDGIMAGHVKHVDAKWFVNNIRKSLKVSGIIGAKAISDSVLKTSAKNAAQQAFQQQQIIQQQIIQQQMMDMTMQQVQQATQDAMNHAMQAAMDASMHTMMASNHAMGMF